MISSDARSIRVFLDGALMATCPLSQAGVHRTSGDMHIGDGWIGMLDDLRLYDRVLTAEEISELYNSLFIDGFESGSVSSWMTTAP